MIITSAGDPSSSSEMYKMAINFSPSKASDINLITRWTSFSTRGKGGRLSTSLKERNILSSQTSYLKSTEAEVWGVKAHSTQRYSSGKGRKITSTYSQGWDLPTSLTDKEWTSHPWALTINSNHSISISYFMLVLSRWQNRKSEGQWWAPPSNADTVWNQCWTLLMMPAQI